MNIPDRPDQPPHDAWEEDARDPNAVADAVAALDRAADALYAAADAMEGPAAVVVAHRLDDMAARVRHWAREVER